MHNLFDWSFLHKQLQEAMKEELDVLRELLSALKEEESLLNQGVTVSKSPKFSKKFQINKQLKSLQKKRSDLTKALGKAFSQEIVIHHFNSKNFNTLVAKDTDNAVETFSLRDQILAIMKMIRQYKKRNHNVTKCPDPSSYLVKEKTTSSKGKPSKIQVLQQDNP